MDRVPMPLKQVSGQRLARLGRTVSDQSLDHRRHGLFRNRRVAESRQKKEETGVGGRHACSTRWCLQQGCELGPAQPGSDAVLIVAGQDEILAPVGMREEVVRGRELLAAVEVRDDREAAGQRHREPGPRGRVVERVQHGVGVAASDPKASGANPSARSAKYTGQKPGASKSGRPSTTGEEEYQCRAITMPGFSPSAVGTVRRPRPLQPTGLTA